MSECSSDSIDSWCNGTGPHETSSRVAERTESCARVTAVFAEQVAQLLPDHEERLVDLNQITSHELRKRQNPPEDN